MRAMLILVLALSAAACKDLTEVVIVAPSDIPVDLSMIGVVAVAEGDAPPMPPMIGDGFGGQVTRLPLVVSVTSGGNTATFSARIALSSDPFGGPSLFVERNVRGVRFAEGQRLMLVLPLLSACACSSPAGPLSSCPPPAPSCDGETPALVPFDEAVASGKTPVLMGMP